LTLPFPMVSSLSDRILPALQYARIQMGNKDYLIKSV
jgi:hypothetical protein